MKRKTTKFKIIPSNLIKVLILKDTKQKEVTDELKDQTKWTLILIDIIQNIIHSICLN